MKSNVTVRLTEFEAAALVSMIETCRVAVQTGVFNRAFTYDDVAIASKVKDALQREMNKRRDYRKLKVG